MHARLDLHLDVITLLSRQHLLHSEFGSDLFFAGTYFNIGLHLPNLGSAFSQNFVHTSSTSSIIIIILWPSLLPLYVSITDNWQQKQFSWIQLLGSDLSITIYCARACIAASISVSTSLQIIQKNSLPVEIYIGIISLLIGLCGYATIIRRDMISSLVAVWVLVALLVAIVTWKIIQTDEIMEVRKCASLYSLCQIARSTLSRKCNRAVRSIFIRTLVESNPKMSCD
ncbi:unnamed protein product [Albugo candida]|uniref:Uncharacterized protein n=1 Tax=Albugo candida TaxID=65357 RepID=A0A024FW59_9STRA|nr:unnamed protein product [Albugo candida]|eukprot:CCI11355.1 unnamed protein product [Albugo candida]